MSKENLLIISKDPTFNITFLHLSFIPLAFYKNELRNKFFKF